MGELPYKDENERRIGEFLIEFNILSREQILTILVKGSALTDSWRELVLSETDLPQLTDLFN